MKRSFRSPGVKRPIAEALDALEPGDFARFTVALGQWKDATVRSFAGEFLGAAVAPVGRMAQATVAFVGHTASGPVVVTVAAYLIRGVELLNDDWYKRKCARALRLSEPS